MLHRSVWVKGGRGILWERLDKIKYIFHVETVWQPGQTGSIHAKNGVFSQADGIPASRRYLRRATGVQTEFASKNNCFYMVL